MSQESNQEGTTSPAQGQEDSNPGGGGEKEQAGNNPYGIPFHNPALVSSNERAVKVTVERKTQESERE